MNRKNRRATAKRAIKGKGGRKLIADTLKGLCDPCIQEKHNFCWGCKCKDKYHQVREREVGRDEDKIVTRTESGLTVVRKRVGSGPEGTGLGRRTV